MSTCSKTRVLTLLVANLLVASPAFTQDSASAEEIIVIADLDQDEVTELIVEVEDQIYELFNANNSSKELDFICRKEVPTGTHFARRICEPTFLTKARQQNNSNFVSGLEAALLSQEALRGELADEFERLNSEYAKLIETNQVFAELVAILNSLNLRLREVSE